MTNTDFAIVTSKFNSEISDSLYSGAKSVFDKKKIKFSSHFVPGSVEIPLTCKLLFENELAKVILALGVVIRGETTHYDSVCRMLEKGIMDVQLDFNKPIIFGVLTCENKKQALERLGGAKGHKGVDVAFAAIEMYELSLKLKGFKVEVD